MYEALKLGYQLWASSKNFPNLPDSDVQGQFDIFQNIDLQAEYYIVRQTW